MASVSVRQELLLTTIGRRTGKRRTTPVLYLEDGDRLVVVASNGGQDRHPAWYLNLVSHDRVEVQRGGGAMAMTAATASPEQKRQLWPIITRRYPIYETYQQRTKREIPVVILSPAER